MIADSLFGVQIIGAVLFSMAYVLRSITNVTGSSVAQVGLIALFLVFNLALGIGAHRASPSRVTRQTITTYIIWLVLILTITGTIVTNPSYHWNEKETTTVVTAMIMTIAVLAVSAVRQLSLTDPMMKAFFAIAYKFMPQVFLAWKFLAEGASGTPGLSVMIGHITILTRLGQIYFMVREAGWDRNRFWLAISEIANEIGWVITTIAWLIV